MSSPNTTPAGANLLTSLLGVVGMSGVAGVLVAAMITPLIAVVGLTANSTIQIFENLPSYLEISALQQKTELYGVSNGQQVKFAEFWEQNREEVPLEDISPYLQAAAISTEDPRFYEHGGVDVRSAARAFATSAIGAEGGGASTITMQYVRNMRIQTAENMPDQDASKRAYDEATEITTGRKLQEMRLAIGVEKEYSKDEILRGYLNIALFGGQVYGVESAAQYYFGKSAKDVTLPEAASLITMVQEPNSYRLDLPENIPGNQMRRDYVLGNMLDEGAITQQEHDEAVATPVTPNVTPTKTGCAMAEHNAQYFCDYVRTTVLNSDVFGDTYELRSFNLRTKGYQIYTTIDLDLQGTAQATMNANIPPSLEGVDIGSAVSMVEPGTGRVLAMAQNTNFADTDETAAQPGYTSVNYNTDYNYGGSTGFQVGSTYKIFTLAEWLATGHSLNSTVNGSRTSFNMSNFQDSCTGGDGGTWPVTNDGGAKIGNVSALQATVNSFNTAYAAMAEQLDQCRIRDTAIQLGAHRADGDMNYSNPSAVLGTNEIAPLSMATAIAGLANNGNSCSPIAIDSITLSDDARTPQAVPPSTCTQAVTPEVAAGVNSALQAVVAGGTGSRSNTGTGIPMTGKTGTTDSSLQTWMIGSTTKTAMAVWVGNASGQVPMTGLGLAQTRHDIFRPIMQAADGIRGGDAFSPPGADATRTEQVTIPDLAGQPLDVAQQTLEGLGFTVTVGPPVSSAQPANTVASTLPSANTTANTGTNVTINPSTGKVDDATITMPDLTGQPYDQAMAEISGAGFASGTMFKHEEANPSVPAGSVIRTEPAAGTAAPSDSDVHVYVSTG